MLNHVTQHNNNPSDTVTKCNLLTCAHGHKCSMFFATLSFVALPVTDRKSMYASMKPSVKVMAFPNLNPEHLCPCTQIGVHLVCIQTAMRLH